MKKMTGMDVNETAAGIASGRAFTKRVVIKDEEYGRGEFIFHRPTILERQQIGLRSAERLNFVDQKSIDPLTRGIAFMAASIEICCDSAPQWFEIDELYSTETLAKVFTEFNNWLDTFRGSVGKTNKGNKRVADATGDMDGSEEAE